ncbi:unnamed protein product [Adineta ricciae]|uniref:V-type proton ATPase subunit S1 n=1 Tax=Adineta ricciae TaxID=249248 RepID=A0A815MVZ6_ADIRI|nr:unnamed protein product [Adineta ricciae]
MHGSISFVLFVLIAISLQSQVRTSPVLLWSNVDLPETSIPLGTISPLDLISNYVCKLSNEKIQLHIVAVDDLNNEDIHRSLNDKKSILADIKKTNNKLRYYPNVNDDIYRTFTLLPQSNNMKCAHIHFQIASSQTVQTLHDAMHKIQETITETETNTDNAVLIALVEHPTSEGRSSRKRRETVAAQKNNIVISTNGTCMFYAKNLTWYGGSATPGVAQEYDLDYSTTTCVPNANATTGNITSVNLNLVWVNQKTPTDIIHMTLTASLLGRYWYLTNTTVNGSEYRYFAYGMHSRMDTPPKYSYVCTTTTFTRYDSTGKYGAYHTNNKFSIKHFQFQPFYANASQFGPPNYCTSFFTSGIWMGITSSLLCLGILLFGIYRMMTIKSNDRYDDPKSKPLVIKAQE